MSDHDECDAFIAEQDTEIAAQRSANAELRAAIAQLRQQLAEARELLQEAWDAGMIWRNGAILWHVDHSGDRAKAIDAAMAAKGESK